MMKQVDSNYKPNPLNVLSLRQLDFMPVHFTCITVQFKYNLQSSIIKWIETNLKGRYCIDNTVFLHDNNIVMQIRLGFEDSKESSYFMLACPHLKYS